MERGGASSAVSGILATVVSAVGTPVPTPVPTPVSTPVPTPVPTPVSTPVSTPVPTPVPTPVSTGFPLVIPIEGPFDLPRWSYPTHPNDDKPKPQSYNIQFIENSLKYIPKFIKTYKNENLQGELFGSNFKNKITIFIVSGPYKQIATFNNLYTHIKQSEALKRTTTHDPNLFNFLHLGSWFFHNDSTMIDPLQNEIDLIRTKMNGPPTISYYICLIIIKKEQNILIYPYFVYNNPAAQLITEKSKILYKSTGLEDDLYESENLLQFIEI